MICFPNAKINLGLYVTEKRTDGFHNLESIFYPIPLCDALEFIETPDKTPELKIEGIELDTTPTDNLIFKAYELLQADFNLPPIAIRLIKNIPVGAGLGGGSADTGFMLTSLNSAFNLNITTKQLEDYALQLGSDCPFFIENTPKLVTGRGEIFAPVHLHLKGCTIVLVNPGIHVSTKEAYAGITPKLPQHSIKEIAEGSIANWKEKLSNDFEGHILSAYPAIAMLKETLYEQGAVYASMSGSGSTVYGIFKNKPEPIKFPKNYFVWEGEL